ncbi:MAG: hypothetical protein PWQ61_3516 [Betaproteobacteria bacterium]|nr:hypothetical protein [Betaproteobacteria bacterium]
MLTRGRLVVIGGKNYHEMNAKVRRNAPRIRARKKSVSLPFDLLERAEKAAATDGRNFSNYVQRLIAADLSPAPARAVALKEVVA